VILAAGGGTRGSQDRSHPQNLDLPESGSLPLGPRRVGLASYRHSDRLPEAAIRLWVASLPVRFRLRLSPRRGSGIDRRGPPPFGQSSGNPIGTDFDSMVPRLVSKRTGSHLTQMYLRFRHFNFRRRRSYYSVVTSTAIFVAGISFAWKGLLCVGLSRRNRSVFCVFCLCVFCYFLCFFVFFCFFLFFFV